MAESEQMTETTIHLSCDRVALAALLIVINGGISLALKLGLERRLAVAALATVVQLVLIGFVLDWVFRVNRWYVVVCLMVMMTIIAGTAALGTVSVVLLGYRRLFNSSHQFLYQLVTEQC
jgi:putative ABC transport system permease protein